MNYLLVGNAECRNVAELAKDADVIVQINSCRHNAALPKRTKYVFVVNSGGQMSSVVQNMPLSELEDATVILARNPMIYGIKQWLLRKSNISGFETFQICPKPSLPIPVKSISCFEAFRLECRMRRNGMAFRCHPSTGMVAYYWLCNRIKDEDSISIAAFTFEGWPGHPWAIERQFIKPIP